MSRSRIRDVDAAVRKGKRIKHICHAAASGCAGMVRVLLEAGANKDLEDGCRSMSSCKDDGWAAWVANAI